MKNNDDWGVSHFVAVAFLQRFDGNKRLQLEVPTSKTSVTLKKFHSRLEENIEVYFVHYLPWHKLRKEKDSTNTCGVTWGAMDTGSSNVESSMDTYTFGLGRWKQQLGHLLGSHCSGRMSTLVALTGLKRAVVSNFQFGCYLLPNFSMVLREYASHCC